LRPAAPSWLGSVASTRLPTSLDPARNHPERHPVLPRDLRAQRPEARRILGGLQIVSRLRRGCLSLREGRHQGDRRSRWKARLDRLRRKRYDRYGSRASPWTMSRTRGGAGIWVSADRGPWLPTCTGVSSGCRAGRRLAIPSRWVVKRVEAPDGRSRARDRCWRCPARPDWPPPCTRGRHGDPTRFGPGVEGGPRPGG
jgi:hypothetical protein